MLLLHQPARLHRRLRRRTALPRLRAVRPGMRGRRRLRRARPEPDTGGGARPESSATRSSTTGPPATSSGIEGQLPFGFFKGKDGAHTLGPYLVTADELEPYRTDDGFLDLTMRAYINDELLGEDSLANMAWTFEELISFASRGSVVGPADVLGSGTCQRGCLTEIWGRAGERTPAAAGPRRRRHPRGRGARDGHATGWSTPTPARRSRPPAAASPGAPATEQGPPDSGRSRRGGPRPVRGCPTPPPSSPPSPPYPSVR